MKNPFVFDRPNSIDAKEFIDFYIKENTYTRFLESSRNLFLIGVRGSGKTSTLKYFSFPIQYLNDDVVEKYRVIGVHIPNKHPLFSKREYLLYENSDKQNVVVEHFLCLNILSCICDSFLQTKDCLKNNLMKEDEIIKNMQFILESEFPKNTPLFKAMKLFLNKEANSSQRKLNEDNFESFIDFAFSFSNTVVPFLEQLSQLPELENSHFSLLFDDVQDLSPIHKRILNSWMSFRDNRLFSFKLATADVNPSFVTINGGVILEGHDFLKIDLTGRMFNKDSEFSKFAKDVIQKRLNLAKIESTVDEFLPMSDSFLVGLERGRKKARELAELKYPDDVGAQRNDYVAKYGRAIYFRDRNAKANFPIYSGFETLVDVSTGVIRNLLTPLYFMYEKECSNKREDKVNTIAPSIQGDVIIKRSEEFWEKINGIASEVDNCSAELSKRINNLFNQLIDYLKRRLKNTEISEPRALNFIISGSRSQSEDELIGEIINACLRSTLLYQRTVGHKASGKKIPLYVPNRLILPAHGLDPHGQYSHFPIKVKDFIDAAIINKEIPLFADEKNDANDNQLEMLF